MIDLTKIKNELLPGVAGIKGQYKQVPLELDDLFVKRQSYMNQEFINYNRFLGIAQLKEDGQSIVFDNEIGDRYRYNMRPIGAGIGTVFTRNVLADNLYKDQFGPMGIGFANSMRGFWNTQAAYLFNTATTYDATSGGTGQPLLSTAHPIDGGTMSNTAATPMSLNEASLVQGIKTIPTAFVDQSGMFTDVMPETLLLPWNIRDVGLRLVNAELRPGTAQNDPNIVHDLNGHIRLKTCRYLTNQYAWFLLTSVKGFICVEREPFEINMWPEWDTDSLKIKSFERKGYFWVDPRSAYGMMATS
jgi:hypothetical protein